MGEAEEVEYRIVFVAPVAFWPEVDEPGLGRAEREPVPAKPLAQDVKHSPGISFGLKEEQRIISVPHEPTPPPHAQRDHSLEPFIQHMVQKDIR